METYPSIDNPWFMLRSLLLLRMQNYLQKRCDDYISFIIYTY